MKKRYKVLSQEGADYAGAQLQQPVELEQEVELDDVFLDQEKALVAAGWLERLEEKKGKK